MHLYSDCGVRQEFLRFCEERFFPIDEECREVRKSYRCYCHLLWWSFNTEKSWSLKEVKTELWKLFFEVKRSSNVSCYPFSAVVLCPEENLTWSVFGLKRLKKVSDLSWYRVNLSECTVITWFWFWFFDFFWGGETLERISRLFINLLQVSSICFVSLWILFPLVFTEWLSWIKSQTSSCFLDSSPSLLAWVGTFAFLGFFAQRSHTLKLIYRVLGAYSDLLLFWICSNWKYSGLGEKKSRF